MKKLASATTVPAWRRAVPDTRIVLFHPGLSNGDGAEGSGNSSFDLLFVGQVAPHKCPDLLLGTMSAARRLSHIPLRASAVGSSIYGTADRLIG
jgi:hypothetical protein